MAFSWVDKVNGVDDILAEDINAIANEVVALSENAGGGGGFRKIGFTEDCDFVATEGDGLTAFRNAVEAAVDGETFYVMPGTYIGSDTLTIAKNLNFIGAGMPVIDFPISVYGEGYEEFNGDSNTLVVPIVSYTSNWDGVIFVKPIEVYHSQSYQGQNIHSVINMTNCIVEAKATGEVSITLMGEFRKSIFKLSARGSYYTSDLVLGGTFYDIDSIFKECKIYLEAPVYQELAAIDSDIYLMYTTTSDTTDYYDFENCRIYNPNGVTLGDTYSSYSNKKAKNCFVFGGNPFGRAESIEGCMMFSGTAL